jgi:hypothetical protein
MVLGGKQDNKPPPNNNKNYSFCSPLSYPRVIPLMSVRCAAILVNEISLSFRIVMSCLQSPVDGKLCIHNQNTSSFTMLGLAIACKRWSTWKENTHDDIEQEKENNQPQCYWKASQD